MTQRVRWVTFKDVSEEGGIPISRRKNSKEHEAHYITFFLP